MLLIAPMAAPKKNPQQALNTAMKKDPEMVKACITANTLLSRVGDLPAQRQLIREAIEAGLDPHRAWAAYIFSMPYEEISADMCHTAKIMNQHVMYDPDFIRTIKLPPGRTITSYL